MLNLDIVSSRSSQRPFVLRISTSRLLYRYHGAVIVFLGDRSLTASFRLQSKISRDSYSITYGLNKRRERCLHRETTDSF